MILRYWTRKIGYADVEVKEATLKDHLELSIRYTMENLGPHQLPLIGHADWKRLSQFELFFQRSI